MLPLRILSCILHLASLILVLVPEGGKQHVTGGRQGSSSTSPEGGSSTSPEGSGRPAGGSHPTATGSRADSSTATRTAEASWSTGASLATRTAEASWSTGTDLLPRSGTLHQHGLARALRRRARRGRPRGLPGKGKGKRQDPSSEKGGAADGSGADSLSPGLRTAAARGRPGTGGGR